MGHKDAHEIIPTTSYGGLSHNNEIMEPFVITVVGMVLSNKALRV